MGRRRSRNGIPRRRGPPARILASLEVNARVLRAIASLACDPHNYYREWLATNLRLRARSPKDWLRLKSGVQRELAQRRSGSPRIHTRDLEAMFPGITATSAKIFPIPAQPYNVSWYELVVLSTIARRLQPKSVFEFGTYDGRTTVHLAANVAADARVYTIDVAEAAFDFGADVEFCESATVGHWFRGHALADRIEAITADAATFDASRFHRRIDFVFVDADHSEAAVLRDSDKAFAMLSAGGVVIWHDYLMIPDVTRALSELASDRTITHIDGTTLAIAFNDNAVNGSR